MTFCSRRSLLASALLIGLAPSTALFAADKPKEIRIDWATYNPVSMVLKDKGLLEREFEKDGITIPGAVRRLSNKALEFLNASSIDFGSTAGSAALVAKDGDLIKSIYVFPRPMDRARHAQGYQHHQGRGSQGKRVAVTRGTDPHIFLARALLAEKLTDKDITPVLLQHADGKAASSAATSTPGGFTR